MPLYSGWSWKCLMETLLFASFMANSSESSRTSQVAKLHWQKYRHGMPVNFKSSLKVSHFMLANLLVFFVLVEWNWSGARVPCLFARLVVIAIPVLMWRDMLLALPASWGGLTGLGLFMESSSMVAWGSLGGRMVDCYRWLLLLQEVNEKMGKEKMHRKL